MLSQRIAAALAATIALAVPAAAREVRLPISVEPPVIRDAIVKKIYDSPGEKAVFWGEPGTCSYFYLVDPQVDGEVDRLRVISKGDAKLGTDLGTGCLSAMGWTGFLEVFEKPKLDGWLLRFEVVDSNLYDENHQKTLLIGQLWDRIKESVQPSFGAVTIDLAQPFRQLRDFLPSVIGQSSPGAAEIRRAIDGMRPVSVRALPRGIVVEAAIQVPDAPASPIPSGTEPPLNEAEIEAFTARANEWDAFVTFVVKTLGAKSISQPARQTLLDTLIDARYQILTILASPSRRQDPVRPLFVRTWERLRPVASEVAHGLPGAEAAQVLTFVAAGDALTALDQLGPSFGIEVSSDGLRRMARMIAPDAKEDPLDYQPGGVDPTLRRFLGMGDAPIEVEPIDPTAPIAEPSPMPSPTSWLRWFLPSSAFAASPPSVDRSKDTRGWVVEDETDVKAYLGRVRATLTRVGNAVVAAKKLEPNDAELLRTLLPVTAWQESCWRQFRRKQGGPTYLRSSRGSVGIMQVNERVWRGFYDVDRLRWQIHYNAEAGAEVLLHYFDLLDDRPSGARKLTTPRDRARAIYAAYNGGPEQFRRYLTAPKRDKVLVRVIDELFGMKLEAKDDTIESQVASCLGAA